MKIIKIKYKNKTYTNLYDFIEDVWKDKRMKVKVVIETTFETLMDEVNIIALNKAYDIIDEIKNKIRKKEIYEKEKWNSK